jgi:hypothetical protein
MKFRLFYTAAFACCISLLAQTAIRGHRVRHPNIPSCIYVVTLNQVVELCYVGGELAGQGEVFVAISYVLPVLMKQEKRNYRIRLQSVPL